MEDVQDELRQSHLRDCSTLNTEIGITGGIPLIGTYTIYLVSKFGMMITQVHLCQHFRDSTQRHPSLCPLRKATLVASGPMHPSPFTNSIGPKAPLWDCQYGRGGVWVVGCGGGLGMEFSIMPKPIQADQCQSTMCVQTIHLNPTQCILRPYLGEAKYTLSYQRLWMSNWNSQFFSECKHIYYAPPLQAVQIKIRAARRKNKHHAV